ncbi:hypothetical protein Ppa06_46390 [Planomonospora parontospora subsp. parontospora]|uniref:Uncharacterized protein n=2 Tax=Planomonospora parontospora TaxID=58119 RepID=A0AA37BKV8_9ACTN|nr:hypothetical protein GCM10010126_52140 [Planomonospora parontospora]GII10841.1 hypothetical protein Ppa06_46390 [Planomonospora parontospora subsp. parontospora]
MPDPRRPYLTGLTDAEWAPLELSAAGRGALAADLASAPELAADLASAPELASAAELAADLGTAPPERPRWCLDLGARRTRVRSGCRSMTPSSEEHARRAWSVAFPGSAERGSGVEVRRGEQACERVGGPVVPPLMGPSAVVDEQVVGLR